MSINPTTLSNALLILAGFTAAFLVALWIGTIAWTYRDIKTRSHDPYVHILALVVVIVLCIPGVFVYLLMRPHQTIEQQYQKTLEEEALLRTIEDASTCPNCNRTIQDEWLICPTCHTNLKQPCVSCKKPLDLSWDICPFCGTPVIIKDFSLENPSTPLI